MHLKSWTHTRITKALSGLLSLSLVASQLAMPLSVEAAPLGSATASAGSAPPPAATVIESFQPDLFTGRATTSIPIVVPPGRKGLQPSLGLSYASSGRNGWLGVGWSLDLGAIERSTKNGVPSYSSSNAFTLILQGIHSDLVNTAGNIYRTKDEGLFLRIVNNGANGWEVRDKSGTRYLFGGTPDTEQTNPQGTFRWALRRVTDPNGNYLSISYVTNQGQLYPLQIQYTGHDSDLLPTNTIDFELEDRTADVETSLRSGALVTTAKRLKTITVRAASQLVRKYQLAYGTSGRTSRSLLSSVTLAGTDETTLPATTFAYQSASQPTYALTSNSGLSGSKLWNVRYAVKDWSDVNGAVLYPSQIVSWPETSGTYTQSSGSFAGFTYSIDAEGRISATAGTDINLYFWTYVLVDTPQQLNVSLSQTEDSQIRFFLNGSTSEVPGWPTKSLSLNEGWNLIEITSYNQNSTFSWSMGGTFASQVDIMNPTQFLRPALSGDFNGDGLTDLARFDQPNQKWDVGLSNATSFNVETSWLTGFGPSGAPLVGDWDGDGKTDVGVYSSGSWQFRRSTGTAFTNQGAPSNLTFGSGTPFVGDFNGDGKLDLGTFNAGSWLVALGTGSGFSPASSFNLNLGTGSDEPVTGDFNGDGLTDVGIAKPSGNVTVALSTGSGFVLQTPDWTTAFGAGNEHLVADFNGDGFSDVAYFNRTSHQVIVAASTGTGFATGQALNVTFTMGDANDQVQVGDFNGDGLADPAVFDPIDGAGELAFSSGQIVDLLTSFTNGLGGSVALTYVASSLLDNTGGDGVPDLPYVIPVVESLSVSDGMGNTYATGYSYANGRYEGVAKEFHGFGVVTVTDPEGNHSEVIFGQDSDTKGRVLSQTFRNQAGGLYSQQQNTWTCSSPDPGVRLCQLDRRVETTFGGDASSKQAAVSYEYDALGNLQEVTEEGDTSVSGDERITQVSYAPNTTDWIISRPAVIISFAADGTTKLKEQRFFYDQHPLATDPPTIGNLTRVEEWLNTTSTYLGTTLTYDAYGNVTGITDPLNRTTTLGYDAARHTFLETLTNAVGHIQEFERDAKFGVVTSATDPNGNTTTVSYDAFGRPTTVLGPNDTTQFPAVTFAYDLSTTPGVPNRVTTITREQSQQTSTLTSYSFFDGFGRTIQARSPAEASGQQVVSGVVSFNNRGLPDAHWAPYVEAFSTAYVTPDPGRPKVTYDYDPVGRVTSVTEPTGTTTAAYDDWVVTILDANSHQTRRTSDAYGQIVAVEEFNGAQAATTTYQYDARGRLTQVTDAQAHTSQLAYDSLDRQVQIDDPDAGTWTYAYDTVDNLISQQDARGVTQQFTYNDPLHRLTQQAFTVPPNSGISDPGPATFTYDDPIVPNAKGELTRIADASGVTAFEEYDELGRVVKETRTISVSPYTFQATFDLLDRLTRLTYPDGEAVDYTYNPQGLDEVASTATTYAQDIDYDPLGRPTHLALGNGVTTDYTYHTQTLRLTQLTTTSPQATVLQGLTYAYDAVGNITAIDDVVAPGTSQDFAYDDLDRLIQASGGYGALSFALDPLGNLTAKGSVTLTYGNLAGDQPHAVTATSDGWVFAYDANGNMVSRTAADQAPAAQLLAAKRFSFNADNRLIQVDIPSEESVAVTFQSGWNFFSLPVVPDDLSVAAVFPAFGANFSQVARHNASTDQFEHYVGNATFDQFTELEYGRGYQVYCTNPNGVTLTFTGSAPTTVPAVSLTAGWRLIGSTALTSQPVAWLLGGVGYDAVHRYDPETGSLPSATQAQPAEALFLHTPSSGIWNPPLPTNVSTLMVYDATGDRVKKVSASGTTTYIGDAYEVGASGPTKHVFIGGVQVASKTANSLLFYHQDHLGSTHVLTNASGAETGRYSYAPFGEVVEKTGTAAAARQFTGQEFDPETGLAFYNARYYDPTIGRFLSADPIVQDQADPQFLNRFAYARNNPTLFTDPSGNFIESFGLIAGLLMLAATAYGAYQQSQQGRVGSSGLPPGPIQPTAFVPLSPLVGVSFAQSRFGPPKVGGHVAGAELNIRAMQQLATMIRKADPDLLADLALSATSDFFGGFSDSLSFGLTGYIREGVGLNNYVDESSGPYRAGQVAGVGLGIAIGGAGSLNAGGRTVLYSGHGAREAARAGRGTGLLLEQTLGGRALNGLETLSTALTGSRLPQPVWDIASGIFAANAKGPIHIFLRNPSARSVYNRVERPVLELFKNTVKRFM